MIGKRIKYLREMQKLSQQELGKKAGLTHSSIGMIEQGRRNPAPEKLKLLADALETTTDYLLGRTELVDSILTQKDLEQLLGKGNYPDWLEWIELAKYIDKTKLTPQKVKEMLKGIIAAMEKED